MLLMFLMTMIMEFTINDDDYDVCCCRQRLWSYSLMTMTARDVVNHDDNKVCFDDKCWSSWWQWLWAAQHHRHISADQLLLLEAQLVSSRRSVLKFKINVGFWSKEHCIVSCRSSGILAPLSSKLLGCEVFPLLSLTWALNNRLNQG